MERSEALARIGAGDIAFVLAASPSRYGELAKIDPALPYFVDLRAEALGADASIRSALLRQTWLHARGSARREAGKRLIALLSEPGLSDHRFLSAEMGDEAIETAKVYASAFPDDPDGRAQLAECLYARKQYGKTVSLFPDSAPPRTDRERAVLVCASVALQASDAGDQVERFFLTGTLGPYHAAAFDEIQRLDPRFFAASSRERTISALIRGRNANLDRAYKDALYLFKTVLDADQGPFVRSPDLLGELGRAYQFSGSAKEGAARFEKWAASAEDDALRFRLYLYAGRMRRQLNENDAANLLFAKALPFAPDGTQRDACVWYILDGASAVSPSSAVPLLRKYAPSWKTPATFTDFLDSLCADLIRAKDWQGLLDAFRVIRPIAEKPIVARYAYVLGRAVSLGYISADRPVEMLERNAGFERASASDRAEIASSFFRIAFESDEASFYYRCMAASRLGENVDPIPSESAGGNAPADGFGSSSAVSAPRAAVLSASEEALFLLKFFDFGAASYAFPIAQSLSPRLSAEEIYAVSAAFARAARYGDSVRFAANLSRRPGYRLTRGDMELLYPRYFSAEISAGAKRWGLSEELFFALIRTESLFIADVGSRAGAVGLAQLMRPTANDVARRIGKDTDLKFDGEDADLKDPATNAMLGAWYLADLNRRLERPILSLFAYNGGITRVRRWRTAESRIPDDLFLETVPIAETQDYGRKVLAAAAVYGYLYYGKTLERVVSDIFPK